VEINYDQFNFTGFWMFHGSFRCPWTCLDVTTFLQSKNEASITDDWSFPESLKDTFLGALK
jgi:hypothetical protein